MEPNRFHLLLTVSLAGLVGFGAAHLISANDAVAYPSGVAVSYGANPIFSIGGVMDISSGSASVSPGVESTGNDIVITDVSLAGAASNGNCTYEGSVSLTDGSAVLAHYFVAYDSITDNGFDPTNYSYSSGIRVPDGSVLSVEGAITWEGLCGSSGNNAYVYYTLSGYYAEP
jgi:hypothetical protein